MDGTLVNTAFEQSRSLGGTLFELDMEIDTTESKGMNLSLRIAIHLTAAFQCTWR